MNDQKPPEAPKQNPPPLVFGTPPMSAEERAKLKAIEVKVPKRRSRRR